MATKLTPAQNNLIESLKTGMTIEYFKGIGARFAPSASLQMDGKQVKTVSVATVRKLRDLGMLEEFDRQYPHSKYKLKN